MKEINPIQLLKEEMDADEVNLKVNAIHRMKTIMLAMSPDEIRGDLFKYLNHLIDTECDEVNFAIAEEFGKLEIYKHCDQSQLLDSLERLA